MESISKTNTWHVQVLSERYGMPVWDTLTRLTSYDDAAYVCKMSTEICRVAYCVPDEHHPHFTIEKAIYWIHDTVSSKVHWNRPGARRC